MKKITQHIFSIIVAIIFISIIGLLMLQTNSYNDKKNILIKLKRYMNNLF